MFEHYLITRFNLVVPQWRKVDKNNVPTLTEEWLKHRFDLFDAYTLPSVMIQRNIEFTWLVLFDINTPTNWMKRIAQYVSFIPIYLTSDWLKELQRLLRVMCKEPWIITTRLDNDDCVDPDFIETIQENFTRRKTFLNIPNGWINNKKIHHRANPFISYIEPSIECLTAYFMPHGNAMKNHAPIRQITSQRLWKQNIHTRNYLNT